MIVQFFNQQLDAIRMCAFKKTITLMVIFLAITINSVANPTTQVNKPINNSSNGLHAELLRIRSEDLNAIRSKIAFVLQQQNDYISSLNPDVVALIRHNYPNYKFYSSSCTEHYTQTTTEEYLVPMLSLATKSIKYLLLIAVKNNSYKIKEFGNLALTGENSGWPLTWCGDTSDILKLWDSKDPEKEKWFRKPLNNGLGYFCAMRDDSLYQDVCYQYDKKYQDFNRIYVRYGGDY